MATVLDSIVAGAAKAITLPENLEGNLESGADEFRAGLIRLPSDANLGAEPNIVIAEYWMDETPGTRMTAGDTWDSALYGSQTEINFPKIFDLNGVGGIGSRNVTGGNELTGFVKIIPEYKSFFTIWQMGVPSGYYFSGASAVETLPPGSNLKMIWDTWDALGADDYNDVVNMSRNGTTTWFFGGNRSNVQTYCGGSFDFNVPNTFMSYHKSGEDGFLDNGVARAYISTSAGVETYEKTTDPLYKKISTLVITAQNNALYTVSIDGVPSGSYTSDGDATPTEIRDNLINEINAATSALEASASTSTRITLTANGDTNPVVTASANLQVVATRDSFTHVSTIWQGNDNQANCLHVFPLIYRAVDYVDQEVSTCGNAVVLGAHPVFEDNENGDFMPLNPYDWDGKIFRASTTQKAGRPYWFSLIDGIPVDSGVYENA